MKNETISIGNAGCCRDYRDFELVALLPPMVRADDDEIWPVKERLVGERMEISRKISAGSPALELNFRADVL